MKKHLLSIFALAMLMAYTTVGHAQRVYSRITSASELEAGVQYLIVGYDENLGYCAMGYQKNTNRNAIQVSENGGSINITPGTDPASETDVFEFTLDGSEGHWTFFDPYGKVNASTTGGFLYAASSSANQLKTQATNNANGEWDIVFDADGNAEVTAQGENTRNIMRFNENSNNGAPLFNCYNSSSSINVPVSLYKAGGAPVIDPEPTNYPTNFTARATGVEITLVWSDATGAQLPSKYLVIGSTEDIRVPQDGTPVSNGDLAMNVNYGVQTAVFSGLEPGTTYHFAIFPYTNAGSNIDYKTDGNYPTANARTQSFFLYEDFNDELGQFTQVSVLGDKMWGQASYNGITYAIMNAYVSSGVYEESEDWLISPALELPEGASYINLEFRNAMKFGGNDLQVLVSNDYSGEGDPNDAEWMDITSNFNWSTGNYEWVESGSVDIESIVEGTFYVAFLYACGTDAGASWEIDWVRMTTDGGLSVTENSYATLNVYPNPANDKVSFNLENDAQVSLFDMTGRKVSEQNMTAGEAQYQVAGLENGVYFLNIRYNNGKTEVARFVKF